MKIGFVSDAHGNYDAFLQAINILKSKEVDEIFFLGDAIGYFDSSEVVNYIHNQKIKATKGNHEEMVILQNVPEEKEKTYRLKQHYNSQLLPIITNWPKSFSLNIREKQLHLFHGSIDNPIWGYTNESFELSEELEYDLIVCGATHRPFVKQSHNTILANIGSCGFPRDIGNQGSCGIYDVENHNFTIERFNISESIERLKSTHRNLESAVLAVWKRR